MKITRSALKERQECAEAICWYCRCGFALNPGEIMFQFKHYHPQGSVATKPEMHPNELNSNVLCEAWKIHARSN